ncbi:unnamed protein product, partial [Dracunculus medinensis]|uniref:Protein kinase domain-containing protein n=1 Tax=Dracunculus medinensis TaxID=318479 RepID=A0A0N4UAL6_DRAME
GLWLANIDRDHSRLRESYSLSALNQRQLNAVRTSKSSDNLHRVTVRVTPPISRKSSIFSLRSIFNFWRPSRSRSTHNNNLSGSKDSNSQSSYDSRKRRPRSANFDPNSLILSTGKELLLPIHDINEIYRKIEKLGEGSYAVVYKSENKIDGRIVALKEIRLHNHEGLPFTAIREASLLRALRHANIVTLHDIVHEQDSLIFVFEYMKTDLGKYLEQYKNGLDPIQIKLFLFQLLRGLAYCHERKILHRDLKPQNLLLNDNGELKLADFGLARAKSVPSRTFSHEVVTLWYRPPDVLLGSTNYSTSLDLWGVGCILAEMCTGSALFPGTKDVVDQLDRIFSIRGLPDRTKWPEIISFPHFDLNLYPPYTEMQWKDVHPSLDKLKNGLSLLNLFLQLNPSDRISANAAMMHPYFVNLPSTIHLLPPTASIFSLPQLCKLSRLSLHINLLSH